MVTTYHLGADDFWEIWETLVLEHSFNISSSIFYLIYPKFQGKIVLFLQFLQVKSHSINVSGVEAYIS